MLLFLTTNMAAVTSRANQQYRVLPYLTSVMCIHLSFAMILDNTTSPDYQLCVKTMYQARDKEIV